MTVETIPILPSSDFDATSAFFARLGFVENGRWPERYLILEHPMGIELHFFWSRKLRPRSNDHGAYVRFSDSRQVDDLHASWVGIELGEGRVTHPEDTDYGLREFALLDPARNLLRIGGFLRPTPRSGRGDGRADP